MRYLFVTLALVCWIVAGCSDESGGERSGEGESCTKTADCVDGLRCVALTCARDTTAVKKEWSDYLDKVIPAYCAWAGDKCSSTWTKAECLAEVQKEGVKATALNCARNLDYYQKNKAALDACLTADPACGGDDLKHFCALLSGVDFDKCAPPTKLDGGVKTDSGTTPNCVQTTFKVTNWPGSSSNNSLYTGTSWKMKDCTEIQPDNLTITVKCPKGAFGNARLISEGCGVLGIAAPGNVLTDVGSAPSGGYNKCSGQTVSNTTITCYQECKKLLKFQISNGPCQ
jgi:hypothetical protein